MQNIRWLTFGISNALTRTIVHFFPSEGGVTAPYQANCHLRIFGQNLFGPGVNEKKVVLEGARLSHPDGVRIEDVFPSIHAEQVGMFGLEVELASVQQRVDLSGSSVVVELASKGHSAKFWPALIDDDGSRNQSDIDRIAKEIKLAKEKREEALQQQLLKDSGVELPATSPGNDKPEIPFSQSVVPLIHDAFNTSSIVVVNGTGSQFTPLVSLDTQSNADDIQQIFPQGFPSLAVTEKSFDESTYDLAATGALENGSANSFTPRECSWGLLRCRALRYRTECSGEPRATFFVLRDALTRRPVSVHAL